jgi:hypothetical protein
MIRIDLSTRSSTHRHLVVVIGLAVAFGAFAGAIYTSKLKSWMQETFADNVPSGSMPERHASLSSSEPPLPTLAGSDFAWKAVGLSDRLLPSMQVASLTADANGGFAVEGMCTGGSQAVLDSLQHHTVDVRVTSWRSGANSDVSCRATGRFAVPSVPVLQPMESGRFTSLVQQAVERARVSGLQNVTTHAARSAVAHVRNVELHGLGSATSVSRFASSLAQLGTRLRVAHLDVARTTGDTFDRQISISLDAVVVETPRGVNR